MTTAQRLKQKLLVEIEKLPEYRLQEVLDFVSFLLSQKSRYSPGYQEQGKDLDPEKKFCSLLGGVSHGSLAQGIDEELYGV